MPSEYPEQHSASIFNPPTTKLKQMQGIWGQTCLLLYTEIVKLLVVGLGRSSAYCFRPHTASSSDQNQFSESQDRGLWSRTTLPAYCKTVMEIPMGFRERFYYSSIVGLIKPTSPPPVQIRLPPPIRNSRIRHSALILFYFAHCYFLRLTANCFPLVDLRRSH